MSYYFVLVKIIRHAKEVYTKSKCIFLCFLFISTRRTSFHTQVLTGSFHSKLPFYPMPHSPLASLFKVN